MTFKDWLKWAVKHRSNDIKQLLPELKLQDGTELSVQASEWHMCEPEQKLENGDYESVEVYTHGQLVKGFKFLEEVSPYTYPRVDIDTMEEICKMHGGIELIIEINGTESYLGKDIRKWCKDNPDDPAASEIKKLYYSKESKFKPNNKVYYFVEYMSSIEAYRSTGRLDRMGYKLVRDLEKSPRKDR